MLYLGDPDNALTWQEAGEISRHVLQGECPQFAAGESTGCEWASDCFECWFYVLTRE